MSIIDTRGEQMFPVLEQAVIERLRRFGELRLYGPGQALVTAGHAGDGLRRLGLIHSGSVKRVAASVGEGAQVVATLHRMLGEMRIAGLHPGDEPQSPSCDRRVRLRACPAR